MTAIMPMDEPRPRGTVIGERVGGAPLDEGENFFKCNKCGGWFDAPRSRVGRGSRGRAAAPDAGSDSMNQGHRAAQTARRSGETSCE
jgi:hypothetical protein